MDYWIECIDSAFEEAGISATEKAIKHVAECVEGAHEVYGEGTGETVSDRNLYCSVTSEIKRLENELEKEQKKQVCPKCAGKGRIVTGSGALSHGSNSECSRCRGYGKINPGC